MHERPICILHGLQLAFLIETNCDGFDCQALDSGYQGFNQLLDPKQG